MTKILLAAAVAPPGLAANAASQTTAAKNWDVAVIGAGVFGAWSAYWLRKAGLRVVLLDAYGLPTAAPVREANRGSSAQPMVRTISTADGLCVPFLSGRNWQLDVDRRFFMRPACSRSRTIAPTSWRRAGAAWIGKDRWPELERLGIVHEQLGAAELAKRFPQIGLKGNEVGILEPHSGALMPGAGSRYWLKNWCNKDSTTGWRRPLRPLQKAG